MAKEKLIKVSDMHFTITRKKYGRGFQYVWLDGSKIDCKTSLKRIKDMVIPPMWKEVKICELDNGHIQAFGQDLKLRKQYIYHALWQQQRQQEKFQRIVSFARSLPKIRKIANQHLAEKGWHAEKVLSLLVLLLDETGIRIGNKRYSQTNQTYGLTTLRRKHLKLADSRLILEFTGKSHKEREILIDDPYLVKHIKHSALQPGYELFRFKDEQDQWNEVDSDDVNQFIQKHMGEAYSSKDFRTWAGTRFAFEAYPLALQIQQDSPRKKVSNIVVKLVSEQLGNTPTVCRQYYIHPALIARIERDGLPLHADSQFEDTNADEHALSESEQALITLLKSDSIQC